MPQRKRGGTTQLGDEHVIAKQQIFSLLQQTQEYVHAIGQRIDDCPLPCTALACPSKGSAIEHRKRKRERSPTPPAADACVSVHLALPRTPTQEMLPCLQGELRIHQLAGVKWLSNLYMNGFCGILSDELDNDRQVQLIGLYAYLKTKGIGGPFLIVSNNTSLQSWTSELHRLLPQGLLVHAYNSSSSDMMKMLCGPVGHGTVSQTNPLTKVVIMSHEAFTADRLALRGYPFKHIALDISGSGGSLNSMDLCFDMIEKPCVLLLAGSNPAKGQSQKLQNLWPLLRLVLPQGWENIKTGIDSVLLQLTASSASAFLIEIEEMLQDIIDQFVLCRSADEVDLNQPRRDTKMNLYDLLCMDTNE